MATYTEIFNAKGVRLYQGDAREIVPALEPEAIDLVLADPPYGISLDTKNKARGRGRADHNVPEGLERFNRHIAIVNDYPPIYEDDRPFDPTYLLKFPRLILFGGNYYADKLPNSPSWLVWDKLNGLSSKREIGFNDAADFEMAWTNLGGAAKIIPHRWTGLMKESEQRDKRVHPSQKPILLMQHIIRYWTKPGDLILDPYAGSGPVPIAALREGRRCIAIEIMPEYCEITRKRLEAEL